MCCIMCCFKPKCVKITLFLVSILLLGCCAVAIYTAVMLKANPILGIIGGIIGFDIRTIIFYIVIVVGALIVFMMLFIWCVICWRYCCCHWLMAITLTCYCVGFLFIGIAILVIENIFYTEMDKICNGNSDYSTIKDAFSKLYSSADSIYCVSSSSSGCYCQKQTAAVCTTTCSRTYYTTASSTLSGYTVVTKVQSCTSYLSSAYASYGLSFSDVSALSTYLDYFGEIEQSYSCSGFCSKLPIYYFYNSNAGDPSAACKDKIKSELLDSEMKMYGIAFTCIGCIMFLSWFVQYGLCCRRKESSGQGTKRF